MIELKELRLAKGLSQEQMAEKLGYASKSGYSMLELGKINITLKQAKTISDVLETPIEGIIFPKKSN